MLSFLFEQYGYYPSDFNDGKFFVDGWEFRLIKVDADADFVEKLDYYSKVVRDSFLGEGPYIVKTRKGEKISYYDGQKYSLLCVRKTSITFNDLNKFHVLFSDSQVKIDLREVLLTWQDRVSIIERESIVNLRVESPFYSSNLKNIMFCMGLCQNAVQYLSDVIQDYGSVLDHISLTHKRLNCLDSFDFFNPFNFILDHPARDLAELYRNDLIPFDILVACFESYNFDVKVASLFLARLMYSINVLDSVEENVYSKGKNFKVDYSVKKEINKIKKVYLYFKEKYNIRPIVWLEK